MATGISKNKWAKDEKIIIRETYDNTNEKSFLTYSNKLDSATILSKLNVSNYSTTLDNGSSNKLFFGDNLDVLRYLLHYEKLSTSVKLIYIDPPYGTNSIFHSRDNVNTYSDTLTAADYIEFIRRRIFLLYELLTHDGSIYIHLDSNYVFQIKLILDEIFGENNFRSFITRKKCSNKNSTKKTFGNISDYILFYTKSANYTWNRPTEPWTDEKIKKEYTNVDPLTKKRFKKVPIHAPGIRNGETGKEWRGMLPPPGKHWQYTPANLDNLDALGEIYWSSSGNPRRKVFLERSKGIPIQDIWLDVQDSLNQNIKITGFPTEKNPELLKRIVMASSNEGDVVLDCFAGSGTTLGIAKLLKRNWIGIDNSFEAINHIFKRFIEGPKKMGDYVKKSPEDLNTLTLFESLGKYKSDGPELDFNFYIDQEYAAYSRKLMEIWKIKTNRLKKYPEAIEHLKRSDKPFSKIIDKVGECRLKPQQSDFLFLIEAIISQQLSLKASETIVNRLKAHFGNRLTPKNLLKTDLNTLKKLGISERKASYILNLCTQIVNKVLSLDDLENYDNEKVIKILTTVKGIGLWTAKMFLIFVLARENVFPIEDTSFRNGLKDVYNINDDKFEKKVNQIKEKWHPYSSIGAWYVWAFQNEAKIIKAYRL